MWRINDLAECINDDWNVPATRLQETPPVIGEIRRVTAVRTHVSFWHGLTVYLAFACPDQRYFAPYFRKIVHTHEPATADFTALIKRTTRHTEPT